ncbi:MAG TPA: helix-turn-helix transcriptional regulator [Flavobacteriales bacterium]|nr:helix-turn-helix transcriptional regulator [Flavobacteriales bacterium]
MEPATTHSDAEPVHLSPRELEYLILACRYPKPTEADIAEYMGISPKTVQKYCDGVYKALGVTNYIDMYHKAVRLGLVKCMCADEGRGSETA